MTNTIKLLESINEVSKLEQCEKAYTKYVNNHISNVQKAWNNEVSKLDDDFIQSNLDELAEQISHHDESKYSPNEFDAYRANYNPISDQEKIDNEANFQAAWWHHFKNNPHHWQHWLDDNGNFIKDYNLDEIKKAYIEMICDWQAMGYVFGDTAKQYYDQNKDTIKIIPELKEWLEDLLTQLENDKDKLTESNHYKNEEIITLKFPFYALKVYADGPQYSGFEGFYTKNYQIQGEIYPGSANRIIGDNDMLDSALNYVKQYKTEKAAALAADKLNTKFLVYRFEPVYIKSLEDFKQY